MLTGLLFAAALSLELCGLFAIWNWSRRSRPLAWLLGGYGILVALTVLLGLVGNPSPTRVYVGFAGMYLFSGLAWAWFIDGLAPSDWSLPEVIVALLAVAMFVMGL